MEDEPRTKMSKELGCLKCGAKGDVFYWVEYYILPSKLVRKRHRDKNYAVVYCRPCYEKEPDLHLEIGGVPYSASKTPRQYDTPQPCIVCGVDTNAPSELYGVVASSLLIQGSAIENYPLAYLCKACLEKTDVRFA